MNKEKIFELLRGLQKDAEAFNNDYGLMYDGLMEEDIADFCNTIYAYIDSMCEEVNKDD